MSRQVAVALDFSPECEHAFQWALDTFLQRGDFFHLIHCDEDSVSEVFNKMTAGANKTASQILESLTDQLEERKVENCAVCVSKRQCHLTLLSSLNF